jgi:hypothetical protein
MLAATFAIKMDFISAASAEIPELWAFVQSVEFCPDRFVKNVVVANE